MPLPPKHPHPLRSIRSILGKTQLAFANLVGTSAITIKRVENGGLILSDKLAARIFAATGASRFELQKGRRGKAIGYDGNPYTAETFERWTTGWHAPTPAKAETYAKEFSEYIRLLCLAATISKKRSLRSICTALGVAIDEVLRDYGLDDTVIKLWEESALSVKPLPDGSGSFTIISCAVRHLVQPAYHRQGRAAPGTEYYTHIATPRRK